MKSYFILTLLIVCAMTLFPNKVPYRGIGGEGISLGEDTIHQVAEGARKGESRSSTVKLAREPGGLEGSLRTEINAQMLS
jgi:hypothetical protein